MEIDHYPTLVDVIWEKIQGTPEDRERLDFLFSEQRIAEMMGIPYKWDSDACVFGIAQALHDLVDMGYCTGKGNFNGHRWMHVAPSADCPDVPPTAFFATPPLVKIPPYRGRVLQFVHDQAICHEEGITFYTPARISHQQALFTLSPATNESTLHVARGEMIQALLGLEKQGFVAGSIPSGDSTLRVTFKGACWLLIMQPLLQLLGRANMLGDRPEAVEAVQCLIDAYGEVQSKAVPVLYIAVEKLENAVGGEKRLIDFYGRPKAYISDLKQSLQQHRHAETQAHTKLSYRQCLERTTDIIERYIAQQEQNKTEEKD